MPKASPSTLHPISQGSSLADQIRKAIFAQRFKPGDHLNETLLAGEFKASRILIREALMRLEEQGLAVSQPRRGMFVNSLGDRETRQVNSIRLVLEAEALKLCRARCSPELVGQLKGLLEQMEACGTGSPWEAAQIDLEFHRTIWRFSGNEYLEKALDSLCTVLFAHRALEAVGGDERLRWLLSHHKLLLDFIENCSKLTAEESLLAHLKIGYQDPEQYSSLAYNR